jgi:hypothetical protein
VAKGEYRNIHAQDARLDLVVLERLSGAVHRIYDLGMTMFFWHFMRQAAIARHAMVNSMYEGGDPDRWDAHMALIRAFYGY